MLILFVMAEGGEEDEYLGCAGGSFADDVLLGRWCVVGLLGDEGGRLCSGTIELCFVLC